MGGRAGHGVRFELFGGVRASDGAALGGPKQRAVLAVLLLEPGRAVPLDRITDALWGDDPPSRPEASVRGYISNLRAALGDDVALDWRDVGYVAEVAADEVDIHRFERLVERVAARAREGRLLDAADDIETAIALRRGRPFGSLADHPTFAATVVRVEERAAQLEELATDLRLARGEAAELVAELTDAVAAAPFRERRRVQLAMALYRAGRPVEALRSIEAARRVLRDEVGVDPGPELARLQHAILDHDPSLLWRPAVTPVPARPASFVGRRDELARFAEAATDVGVRGGVVVVSGEAGIGKTSLVRAACEQLAPWPAAWARCVEDAVDAPFGAWAAVAAQLSRLGVLEAVEVGAGDDPASTRGVIAASLLNLREPCVVVIDDLQWADAGTLGVLELLADGPPPALLLVVTVRRDDIRPAVLACLGELSRRAVHIDLAGLDPAAVEAWIAERGGGGAAVAHRVHDRTGGHPFFIREVVALLGPDGADDSVLDAVPAAVHDVVRRRVSRLPPTAQRLLTMAAVLGRRVDLGVLAGLVDEPIDAVLDALDPALSAGLLTVDPARIGQVRFAHAIVAEALREELTPARLARAHAAVTRVMERRWAGDLDAVIDELAVHAHAGAAAGSAAAAVEHGSRAAQLAMIANAPGEAAAHLARAVDALAVSAPADRSRRQDLLTSLGTAHAAAGNAMAARPVLVAAAALADARGDVDGVVAAMRHVNGDDLWSGLDWSEVDEPTIALLRRTIDGLPPGPSTARAELVAALSTELYAVDPDGALEAARDAAAMSSAATDPLIEARVLLRLYWAAWRPAGNALRAAAGERLLELVASGRLPARFRPLAHLTRFVAAYECGDGAVVDRQLTLSRSSADALRTPAEWTYVLYAEWSVHVARGQFAAAAALTDAVRDAMRRSRPVVADVTWVGLTAQVAVELGRTDDALGAIERLRSTPYARGASWWRAWALARGDRLDDVAAELRAFDGPLTDDWYRAPLLCAALEAAVLIDDAAFAAAHVGALRPLVDHVAIAGSGGLVLGPIALTVARVDLLLGDRDGARHLLDRAERIAATMGSTLWTARVEEARQQR